MMARCSSMLLRPKLTDEHMRTPRYPPSLRMMVPFLTSLTGTNFCVACAVVVAISLFFSRLFLDIKRPRKVVELAARQARAAPRRPAMRGVGRLDCGAVEFSLGLSFFAPQEELAANVVREGRFKYLDEGLAVHLVKGEGEGEGNHGRGNNDPQ